MKTRFLFPHSFKNIGWCIFVPSFILGILILKDFDFKYLNVTVFKLVSDSKCCIFGENNILDEIDCVLLIISSLFIAFSREKVEDEFINKIRLESLVWATVVNYLLLVFCIIFIYDMAFLYVMIINMFTLLILFFVKFRIAIYRNNRNFDNEK